MKNLATTNQDDFTVLESGQTFISQSKASELLGVPRRTLGDWIHKEISENPPTLEVNDSNQLSPKSLLWMAKSARDKGYEKAGEFLDKTAEGGVNMLLQRLAGYTPKNATSLDIETMAHMAAALQVVTGPITEMVKEHDVRLAALEGNVRKKPASTKSGTYNCEAGYITISDLIYELKRMDKPLGSGTVRELITFYDSSIGRKGKNCYNKKDISEVFLNIFANAEQDGAFMKDTASDKKFKADWLIKQIEENQ